MTDRSALLDPLAQVQLVMPSGSGVAPVVAKGVQGIVAALQANRHDLDERLTSDLRVRCTSVVAIAQSCLFASFTHTVFSDPDLYERGLRPALSQCSLWYERTGQARRHFLSQSAPLALQCGSARLTAERGFEFLESLLAANHGKIDRRYVLGTTSPTSADCYAFAACSSWLYLDASASKDEDLLQWLRDIRSKYGRVVTYIKDIQRQYFDEIGGGSSMRAEMGSGEGGHTRGGQGDLTDSLMSPENVLRGVVFTCSVAALFYALVFKRR